MGLADAPGRRAGQRQTPCVAVTSEELEGTHVDDGWSSVSRVGREWVVEKAGFPADVLGDAHRHGRIVARVDARRTGHEPKITVRRVNEERVGVDVSDAEPASLNVTERDVGAASASDLAATIAPQDRVGDGDVADPRVEDPTTLSSRHVVCDRGIDQQRAVVAKEEKSSSVRHRCVVRDLTVDDPRCARVVEESDRATRTRRGIVPDTTIDDRRARLRISHDGSAGDGRPIVREDAFSNRYLATVVEVEGAPVAAVPVPDREPPHHRLGGFVVDEKKSKPWLTVVLRVRPGRRTRS